MGGVCCRSQPGTLDDDVLRMDLSGDHIITSGDVLLLEMTLTAAAEAEAPVAHRSLANYVSFPFPFVKNKMSSKDRRRLIHAATNDVTAIDKPADPVVVGDYLQQTPLGTYAPRTLVECCLRAISSQLLNARGETRREPLRLPTELAAALMQWLKVHHALKKEQFQVLAPCLVHSWCLQGLLDVDDSWFHDIPNAPWQYLMGLDLSGCAELQYFAADSKPETIQLPNLTIVSFQGCEKLHPRVLAMLKGSSKLTALNLAGCRLITDHSLHALEHHTCLTRLDLTGCRQLTDAGIKSLFRLHQLERLSVKQCGKLTDEVFEDFAVSHPRLQVLDAAYCRLSDQALEYIGRMVRLETLVIRGCKQIQNEGMVHLIPLRKLSYFDARHCEAIHSIPSEWASIRVLLLTRTAFAESDTAALQQFTIAQELDIRGCRILRRGFEFISRMSKLERLVLAETALTDAGLLQICKHLPGLKALNISHTEITDAGTEGLSQLKELRILHMDTSGITNRALANLTFLPMLERLDLFGASITDNGLLHLVPMRRLKELIVCSGNISDRGVELISKISTLVSLNLSQNRNIRSKALFFIRALTELRSLNISNTNVTALSLRHLYPLRNLETLSVYGCALTSRHVSVLREILPELKFLRCS